MGDLKQKVSVISTDLLKKSTKREQENKVLSEKITHVEDNIKKSITTIILTFLITLFAGIIVALFQGWI